MTNVKINLYKYFFLLLFLFLLPVIFLKAQSTKEELLQKETVLKKEIAELNSLLDNTKGARKISMKEIAVIQKKINIRENLVANISSQIKGLNEDIYKNELDIYRMRKELDTLKIMYAQSIVFAYKNRDNTQLLNFLFSAENFNDAFKRIQYLKSYRSLRQRQYDNITKTQKLLQDKIGVLNLIKVEQTTVLQNQKTQLKELEKDKAEKDKIARQLKRKETEINSLIKKKEKQRRDMKYALAAIIKKETIAAEKRAKVAAEIKTSKAISTTKKTANPPSSSSVPNPKTKKEYGKVYVSEEGAALSANFEKKGLPWPVSTGVVVVPFGTYNAGGKLKGVSDGIEIALPEGTAVKSVADGKISYVGDMGGEEVVIVKHGKYYTAYSHLSSINVSNGQEVKAGTVLGKSGTGLDGEGALLFIITNDKGTPLNPLSWLRSR